MNSLEEIRSAIEKFDPELMKNEDEENNLDKDSKELSVDAYQKAIDSAVDPEDLNFSMDDFDDDSSELDTEHFSVPQKDYDEKPLEVGNKVKKVTHPERIGEIIAIGELIEVQWEEDLTTLEYPEELLHAEDPEEEKKTVDVQDDLEENPEEIHIPNIPLIQSGEK